MSLKHFPTSRKRKTLFVYAGALVFTVLIALGVFAKNGWVVPSADSLTFTKTGWFGRQLLKNASSSWHPLADPLPKPTPQYTKEYIYADSRLLAVEDTNANPIPPADLAVWRPSTGTWWVMGGQYSNSAIQSWGMSTDKTAPGDYDGDGKTDFSVFRPGTGQWFVLQSSDNAWGAVFAWGTSSDVLVQADYDGDGKTDRAVWRPADGIWYIVQSSNGVSYSAPYGQNGDLPIPADYDGDGRADLALWRESNKTFYSLNSSNGSAQTITSSIQASSDDWWAASSDYDGDGHSEYALYDKNTATWYVRSSVTGEISATQWGSVEDLPVQNDYDGDGKTDMAIWHDANGNWSIRQSAFDFAPRSVQWGISGDIPVPAFYRR